jgi:hypothetical protein
MRYITKYANLRGEGADHDSAITTVEQMYAGQLQLRLQNSLLSPPVRVAGDLVENPPNKSPDGLTKDLFQFAVLNASMFVRMNASNRYSRCQLLGPIAVQAMQGAFSMIGQLKPVPAIAGLLLKNMKPGVTSGDDFELEVRTRLALGCLAPRAWPLESLDSKTRLESLQPLREVHRAAGFNIEEAEERLAKCRGGTNVALLKDSCQSNTMLWRRMATSTDSCPLHMVSSSESSTNVYIDARVQELVKECVASSSSSSVLISTANGFPGVDFILFRADGEKRSVVFIESTISTLAKHGSSKSKQPKYSETPAVLRDMVFLMGKQFSIAKSDDGAWQYSRNPVQLPYWTTSAPRQKLVSPNQVWSQLNTRDTLANMWLRILGCEKRITIIYKDPMEEGEGGKKLGESMKIVFRDAEYQDAWQVGHADGAVTCESTTSGAHDTEVETGTTACNSEVATADAKSALQWDVSVVYVSGSPEQCSTTYNYETLECDFVYGVFYHDFNDAPQAWLL